MRILVVRITSKNISSFYTVILYRQETSQKTKDPIFGRSELINFFN